SATTTSTSSTTTTSVAPPLLSTTGIFLCDPATCPVAPATAAVTKGLLDDAGNAFSSFSTPGVSTAGDIAFSSRVGSPGFHGSGVYIRQIGGDIVTVALTGDPVPPPSPTAVFKKLTDPPAMSPSGKVAFRGRIKASVSPRNRRGIFLAE
ncbi:MAG TPA: choice-of-anchor tandem repeat NxxGxxAF-containing protein, partial [Candidatus Binatus sp.]|nr:choice-of-anchor tandem repeat NxxGxxAF-containing protein [Candidatus Binatus sp.]